MLFQVILTCTGLFSVSNYVEFLPLPCKIRQILSTLQLHSGMDCCLPLPCAIMFDSSSVPRLFSVSHLYHFLYYYRLTTAKGVYLVRVQSLTVISLLSTPPGAIVTPPGVYWFDCFTIV